MYTTSGKIKHEAPSRSPAKQAGKFYSGKKQSATWRKEAHRARRSAPRSTRSTRTRIPRATARAKTLWRAPFSARPPRSSRRGSECVVRFAALGASSFPAGDGVDAAIGGRNRCGKGEGFGGSFVGGI